MSEQARQPERHLSGRAILWPCALVLLVLGFALFGDRGILHMVKLHHQKVAFEQELAEIRQQNDALQKEIVALNSDRRYIERIARTELGMVREDELVFQFSDKE